MEKSPWRLLQKASIYTCDFSLDYVHINADYTT